jgi:hypothetical protein
MPATQEYPFKSHGLGGLLHRPLTRDTTETVARPRSLHAALTDVEEAPEHRCAPRMPTGCSSF